MASSPDAAPTVETSFLALTPGPLNGQAGWTNIGTYDPINIVAGSGADWGTGNGGARHAVAGWNAQGAYTLTLGFLLNGGDPGTSDILCGHIALDGGTVNAGIDIRTVDPGPDLVVLQTFTENSGEIPCTWGVPHVLKAVRAPGIISTMAFFIDDVLVATLADGPLDATVASGILLTISISNTQEAFARSLQLDT